jgi:hypothetical protein
MATVTIGELGEPVERLALTAADWDMPLAERLGLKPGESVSAGEGGIRVRRADGTVRLIATVPKELNVEPGPDALAEFLGPAGTAHVNAEIAKHYAARGWPLPRIRE